MIIKTEVKHGTLTPQTGSDKKPINVQFNPVSLQYTITNTLKEEGKGKQKAYLHTCTEDEEPIPYSGLKEPIKTLYFSLPSAPRLHERKFRPGKLMLFFIFYKKEEFALFRW